MQKQFKYKNITWIDLTNPSAAEIAEVTGKFNIHPVAAAELSSPSLRSKVDLYDDFIYLVLHFPNHRNSLTTDTNGHDAVEVDFIVGKNFLVTTSYEEIEPMQEFGKIFEANSVLTKNKKDTHAGFLLYHLLKHLYQSLEHNLDLINSHLKKAEAEIFSGNEKGMVKVLSTINKKLLDFRGTLKSHREVLVSLENSGKEFFGDKFQYYLRASGSEYKKAWYALENSREFFNELKQTNESLLQIKTAEATKTFSMLAFVTFPLSLIAAVLGLRAPGTPLVDSAFGFWIIAGLMLALIMGMMAFFKHKKWL